MDTSSLNEQIGGQWRGLIHMMTQQGATREEIAALAASTALTILDLTGGLLWEDSWNPQDDPTDRSWPTGEAFHGNALEDAAKGLQEYIREYIATREAELPVQSEEEGGREVPYVPEVSTEDEGQP